MPSTTCPPGSAEPLNNQGDPHSVVVEPGVVEETRAVGHHLPMVRRENDDEVVVPILGKKGQDRPQLVVEVRDFGIIEAPYEIEVPERLVVPDLPTVGERVTGFGPPASSPLSAQSLGSPS